MSGFDVREIEEKVNESDGKEVSASYQDSITYLIEEARKYSNKCIERFKENGIQAFATTNAVTLLEMHAKKEAIAFVYGRTVGEVSDDMTKAADERRDR